MNGIKKDSLAMKMLFWLLAAGMGVAVFVLIFGGVRGWFASPVEIEAGDYCDGCGKELEDVSAEEYEEMVKEKRSFVLMVDQAGCTTADKVRGFITNYAKEYNLRVYRIMFSEMKKTSLNETVRHYPSVVIFKNGEISKFLRADKDEDAGMYNEENEFLEWMDRNVFNKR